MEAAPATGEPAPMAAAPAPSIDPAALERLSTAIKPLECRGMDLSHTATVEAFRALADALAALPASDTLASSRLIRTTAERLASSPDASRQHADLVKTGLAAGLSAFQDRAPPARHEAGYRAALEHLQRSVESIDAEVPLLRQQEDVAQAFRAAANLVAMAGNAEAPFASAS